VEIRVRFAERVAGRALEDDDPRPVVRCLTGFRLEVRALTARRAFAIGYLLKRQGSSGWTVANPVARGQDGIAVQLNWVV
jgi:hypothetical protein